MISIPTSIRATLYTCFYMPCLIQLFFEKFLRETRNSIEIFRKIIELDKASNRRIKQLLFDLTLETLTFLIQYSKA